MNWTAIAFDWNQIRAFLATAEEGSLSAAARALGLAQPTLGRQVAALESQLGVALFERSGRGLVLTPTGQDLVDHVRAMAEAAARVALVAAGRRDTVAGRVTISASDIVAAWLLPDLLAELRERAPEIEVELLATNALSDLTRREADIALRHVRPEDPALVARLVQTGEGGLFAAPAFLRRHPRPETAADLAALPFVGMAPPEVMAAELRRRGLPVDPRNVVVHSDSMVVAWEMVRRGLGIGVSTVEIARRSGDLVRLLPDLPPIPVPLWLTTHREVQTSRRIRLVYDFLAEGLGR